MSCTLNIACHLLRLTCSATHSTIQGPEASFVGSVAPVFDDNYERNGLFLSIAQGGESLNIMSRILSCSRSIDAVNLPVSVQELQGQDMPDLTLKSRLSSVALPLCQDAGKASLFHQRLEILKRRSTTYT